MHREFKVPRKEDALEHDRRLLYALEQSMGFVPNIYAFMTRSETALKRFLDFIDVPTVFNPVEAEVIHLITSQINRSPYCLAVHTALAKQAGLTEDEIEKIRRGNVKHNEKFGVLVDFACELVTKRGQVSSEMTERFYNVGYTDAHLVDLVMLIGMTTITNYISNTTQLPLDFPPAPEIICNCDCKQ